MRETENSLKKWLSSLGPAIITAALVLGPGSVTITSKMGALYGYSLLWVTALSAIFMMTFTEMSARIGMATNQSLLTTIRQKWGKTAAIIIGTGSFLVTASFQAGNAIGSGVAFSQLTGGHSSVWVILFTLLCMALLFSSNFYRILEKIMLILVGIMLIAFLATFITAKPSPQGIAAGLIPSVPDGSALLIIGLMATSFSIVGAFYQSYLVQEKGWSKAHVREGARESYSGIVLLGFISALIMMSAAAVLLPQGFQVNTPTDMGKALEPLFGNGATTIFMIGLWGASFSSLTGNATIGGTLLSDALGLGSKLSAKTVRICIMSVMAAGAIVAVSFGQIPLQLIVLAQAITIIIVPLIGFALYAVANDTKIMGGLANKGARNIIALAGLVVLLILAANTVYTLLIK
ncbi:Nramp family divalent metal transporter [Paenactinomyces guangxiensis]|uniref:Nramp family divalent metal transporter n=1 Tax=Paenactinomyces guangxiensis TaxID=1490290 RepID=A0A7W1WRG1_9BACL|nr:Nramp family divalent metal transporter [Paenactinomyces guangxiensis]MBA4494685.1 Nramp family divalent metal transporter [Paenactinomyces guangxiensis]MBH8591769.1 Nramp family divalent metal transporter [Paenactinomyces guangxiensis]